MKRSDYFVQWRAALLELDEGTLGAYVLSSIRMMPVTRLPTEISAIELNRYLFPKFPQGQGEEKVCGTPTVSLLARLAAHGEERFKSQATPKELARYAADCLALGQRARDLLLGVPAARWNVAEEWRRELEVRWERHERWAVEAEATAATRRREANTLREELDGVLAELRSLSE